ncbi:hypothetical protein [Natronoglomus mannanivorans]|uniref:Uncharacterized protein n=1 Tax=Natronoglomus mannanivorans TaxID=2979990 RepID=A0AAP3E5D9_9EURY|nr:hypothetical protein [Halobacteria archaeon AArc-xg1-1]
MKYDADATIEKMEKAMEDIDNTPLSERLAEDESWERMPPEFRDMIEAFDSSLAHRTHILEVYVDMIQAFEKEFGEELSEDGTEFLRMIVEMGEITVEGVSNPSSNCHESRGR